MDDEPSHTPSGHNELFGQSTEGDDRHIACEEVHGMEVSVEDAFAVDLVRNDGQLMLAGNRCNAKQMLCREVGSAGVGRVVDHDGLGVLVHQCVHGLQIAFPGTIRQQWVVLDPSAEGFSDDLTEEGQSAAEQAQGAGEGKYLIKRKAGLGHQDIVTFIHKHSQSKLYRTRAA